MKIFAVILVGLAAVGCASTTAPSFDSLLVTAGTLEDASILTADAALKSGVITAAQATTVANVADKVKAALDAARAAYLISDTATATAKLTAATTVLSGLSLCLKPPITMTSFDACLTAIPVGDL